MLWLWYGVAVVDNGQHCIESFDGHAPGIAAT